MVLCHLKNSMNLLLVESILLPPPQQNAQTPSLGIINLLATPIFLAVAPFVLTNVAQNGSGRVPTANFGFKTQYF